MTLPVAFCCESLSERACLWDEEILKTAKVPNPTKTPAALHSFMRYSLYGNWLFFRGRSLKISAWVYRLAIAFQRVQHAFKVVWGA